MTGGSDRDTRTAWELAHAEARNLGHGVVGTEHMLLALTQAGGRAEAALTLVGVTAAQLRARIVELRGRRDWTVAEPPLTSNLRHAAQAAQSFAFQRRGLVETRHLLLALAERPSTAAEILRTVGITPTDLIQALYRTRDTGGDAPGSPRTAPVPAPTDAAAHLLPVRAESTLVLTGTAEYGSPELAPIPHVPRNIADLAAVLTTGPYAAFAPDRVHVLADLTGGELPAIADLARDTADTFVLYYSGHGLTDTRGDLYLCHTGTRPEHVEYTAFEYEKVRRILLSSPARRKLVVLDCCHAGQAVNTLSADGLSGVVDIRGAHVLAAAAATRKALAPPDEEHTAFTAVLLEVLRDGVDPASELIHLAREFPRMAARLRSSGRPVPQQSLDGAIAEFAIARNPRWTG